MRIASVNSKVAKSLIFIKSTSDSNRNSRTSAKTTITSEYQDRGQQAEWLQIE